MGPSSCASFVPASLVVLSTALSNRPTKAHTSQESCTTMATTDQCTPTPKCPLCPDTQAPHLPSPPRAPPLTSLLLLPIPSQRGLWVGRTHFPRKTAEPLILDTTRCQNDMENNLNKISYKIYFSIRKNN